MATNVTKPSSWNVQPELTQAPDLWRQAEVVLPFFGGSPLNVVNGKFPNDLYVNRGVSVSGDGLDLSGATGDVNGTVNNYPITFDSDYLSILCAVEAKQSSGTQSETLVFVEAGTFKHFGFQTINKGGDQFRTSSFNSNITVAGDLTFVERTEPGQKDLIVGFVRVRPAETAVFRLDPVLGFASNRDTTVTNSPSTSTMDSLGFSGFNNSNVFSFVAAWKGRDFTDGDVQRLLADPYAMIRPREF
jgi:hypothetical protein